MIELETNKQYIIQSNTISSVKKIEVLEITNTTYLIKDIDNFQTIKERILRKDFNRRFSVIEVIDKPNINNIADIDTLIMNARSYGKNAKDNYGIYIAGQWSPYNNK